MRLLHTTELQFQDFYDAEIPHYAILSHRWGPDEVSYHDFLAGRKKNGAGYAKILQSCKVAARGGYLSGHNERRTEPAAWIWIDTCCIDKSSSADLSETINSMYRWYQKSRICYVFLNDVILSENRIGTMSAFVQSEWFARGWTLQELLAPQCVVFLEKNQVALGNKYTLGEYIHYATGIKRQYLDSSSDKIGATIAEKMMWARERETSRIEDHAYCLLGLFNINMPLLYGEGVSAFRRLQLELLKSSDDESIFAWNDITDIGDVMGNAEGVLSISPNRFRENSQREQGIRFSPVGGVHRAPYSVTNKGLEFQIPAYLAGENTILLPLNCSESLGGLNGECVFAIAIERQYYPDTGCWVRAAAPYYHKSGYTSVSRGLYVVPKDRLWSRETLKKSGSEAVYLQL